MPELSVFDERLAEIDRRLRAIQSGLEPAAAERPEPPPAAAEAGPEPAAVTAPLPPPTQLRPAPAPAPDSEPVGSARLLSELHELRGAHERLLELHRDLLSQYAEFLERRAGEAASAVLTAGPFADADALRVFERALEGLPGVIGVAVREYLGADRVALEVRLAQR